LPPDLQAGDGGGELSTLFQFSQRMTLFSHREPPEFLPAIGGKKIRRVENILRCVMSTNSFLSLLFLYYLIIPRCALLAR
jgi:hypothetical protein